MSGFLWGTLLLLLIGIVLRCLYISGYLVIASKRAVLFTGSAGLGKNRCWANVLSCSGHLRRVLNLKRTGEYRFLFSSRLSKGAVWAEIQDRRKQILLTLDGEHPSGDLPLERDERYYLVIRLERADGNYELSWNEIGERCN